MMIDDRTADFFRQNAIQLVPVHYKSKAAIDVDFAKNTLTVDEFIAKTKDQNTNVGVLLVPPLVDVDIDLPRKSYYFNYVHKFFPHSVAVFGHASSPNSHLLYKVKDSKSTPVTKLQIKGSDYAVEIRASSTLQSVVPPSVHVSGEPIEWSDDSLLGTLTEVTFEELDWSRRRFLAAAALADLWSGMQGARHLAALPLAGAVFRLYKSRPGLFDDAAAAKQFIRCIFEMAGDEETHDRMRAVNDTFKKFERGAEKLTGVRRLIEFFGKESEKEIKSAFSLLINDRLLERVETFNEEFASIIVGGKSAFIRTKDDDSQYTLWDLASLRSHGTATEPPIEVSTAKSVKLVPFVEVWRNHSGRRHYSRGLDFVPPQSVKDECPLLPEKYNTYTGFKTKPIEGDVSPFLSYVNEVVANGDAAHAEWVLAWCADIVQHPGDRSRTGLVLRGKERTGKTTLGTIMRKVVDPYGSEIDKIDALTGRFNAHLSGKLLIVANEAVFAGDRSQHSRLKSLITDETITIEHKGVNSFAERSYIRVLLTTNERWAVPASFTEQRWTVLDVSDRRANDKTYFNSLYSWLGDAGYEKVANYLLNLEYDRELIKTNIKTAALMEQQEQTVSPVILWWKEQLEAGFIGSDVEVDSSWYKGTKNGFDGRVMRELFMMSYEEWGKNQRRYHNVTNVDMGIIMREFLGKQSAAPRRHPCNIYDKEQRIWQKQFRYFYTTPSLQRAREIYKEITGNEIVPMEVDDSVLTPFTLTQRL